MTSSIISPSNLASSSSSSTKKWMVQTIYSEEEYCSPDKILKISGHKVNMCIQSFENKIQVGSLLLNYSETDNNFVSYQYLDPKCKENKFKWDINSRSFNGIELEYRIIKCGSFDFNRKYSIEYKESDKIPLLGSFVVNIGFNNYDSCISSNKIIDNNNAQNSTYFDAYSDNCFEDSGKFILYNCSSGLPYLNRYKDRNCKILESTLLLSTDCVENNVNSAFSYWSCSNNGIVLPVPYYDKDNISFDNMLFILIPLVLLYHMYNLLFRNIAEVTLEPNMKTKTNSTEQWIPKPIRTIENLLSANKEIDRLKSIVLNLQHENEELLGKIDQLRKENLKLINPNI